MKKILIIAGDTSGDIHAANLMKFVLLNQPSLSFVGIGGQQMTQLGLEKIIDLNEISVVGFWEVFKKINVFLKLKKQIKSLLTQKQISLFIAVDFPGFNIEIAKICKEYNIPVLWFIAPQLWAWGENRANKFRKNIDKLLVAFPFEVDFFEKHNIPTHFVGHPLLVNPIFNEPIKSFDDRQNILLIMPGSRKQELLYHLHILLNFSDNFKVENHNYDIVFSIPQALEQFAIDKFPKIKKFQIENNSLELMKIAKIGLVKSGTSNLEAALLGMPFVMFYKTSLFNYALGSSLTKLQYFSIVNILLENKVIPELIQNDFNNENLQHNLLSILDNRSKYDSLQNSFLKIKEMLAIPNTFEKISEIVLNLIDKK